MKRFSFGAWFEERATEEHIALKYHLITLGCPKNKVDSDGIEMLLQNADYHATDEARQADVLIVNTCGFLEASKEESIGVLTDLGNAKRRDQIRCGWLSRQRGGDEVLQRVPKVDGPLGTRRYGCFAVAGANPRRQAKRPITKLSALGDPDVEFISAVPRPPVAAGSAYLKISDGCNALRLLLDSTFKGEAESRPLEAIVDETRIGGSGRQGIVLVCPGQRTTMATLAIPTACPPAFGDLQPHR